MTPPIVTVLVAINVALVVIALVVVRHRMHQDRRMTDLRLHRMAQRLHNLEQWKGNHVSMHPGPTSTPPWPYLRDRDDETRHIAYDGDTITGPSPYKIHHYHAGGQPIEGSVRDCPACSPAWNALPPPLTFPRSD
jgi:hypothetical protein